MCETETSGTDVVDDVPNCEIEQVEVCNEEEEGTVCRTVPIQKCNIMEQGCYLVVLSGKLKGYIV